MKNFAGNEIQTRNLLTFLDLVELLGLRPPSVLHSWDPTGSWFSGGPSSGCHSHSFGRQQTNPQSVHPGELSSDSLNFLSLTRKVGLVVAQLAERSLLTPGICGWNPDIGNELF